MSITENNEQLVIRLNNDDNEAFQLLYNSYRQAVFSNIRRLVRREEEAEDILQNVFTALWENRRSLTISQSLPGWLFTTSYYKSLEYLRKSIRLNLSALTEAQLNLAGNETEPSDESSSVKLAFIDRAIAGLPPRKRMAFQLCRIEGKTYEETAALLDISVESVRDYVKSSSSHIRKQVLKKNFALGVLLFSLYFSA